MMISELLLLFAAGCGGDLPGDPPSARTADEPAAPAQDPDDIRFFWKDGLRWETANGRVNGRIGGRIQADYASIGNSRVIENTRTGSGSKIGAFEDGVEFRTVRMFMSGEIDDRIGWKAQVDFAGGSAVFKDVYLSFADVAGSGADLQVGQFKEPFSLEELTSSNYITNMERSLANAFAPGRSTGFQLSGQAEETFTWAAGVFKDGNDQGLALNDADTNVTARVTAVPWTGNGGESLLHVGLNGSYRMPNGDMLRINQRPESHLSPRLVDTGAFAVDGQSTYGFEAALVLDRWSVQGEYMMSMADGLAPGAPSVDFSGYYVEGSYFLTDDRRNYDARSGAFSRTKPTASLFGDDDEACGAWQARLRYSMIDLSDGPVLGGELSDVTAGLTWFLNNNTRIMAEVVQADLDGVDDTTIFQTRFQVDW